MKNGRETIVFIGGLPQNDQVTVHVSVMRPGVEYASLVGHTNSTQYVSANIEIIQKRAL